MNQIRRRQFLLAVGAGSLSLSLPVLAQQEKRVRRIGYIAANNSGVSAPWLNAFRAGMAELQWVAERDYVIDARYPNGVIQALPGLAAELVASQPDLILTTDEAMVHLFDQRTKTLPIVFAIAADPVGSGVASSLRNPNGNATGLTNLSADLAAKLLELLKDAFPRVSQIVVLVERDNVVSVAQAREIARAAPQLKMRVTPIELQQAAEIEPAFKRGTALGVQAYVITQSGFFGAQRELIQKLILRSKVPSIYPNGDFVNAGGLMSYGSSIAGNFRRAAVYVDKILKGTKPGDLPIEQPTRYELVLNLKTAKATGINFPKTILFRADRVIE
jgi:putative ABC transport system substrate-binding protein